MTREVLGNIDAVSRCVMYVLAIVALSSFTWGVWRRARFWKLGRPGNDRIVWTSAMARLFTHVLSQRTLHGDRPAAGRAHRLMFVGFVVLFVGTILIAIEHYGAAMLGRAHDSPLFHKGLYFAIYEIVLDTAGLALLAGCAWFLVRRMRANSSIGRSPVDVYVLALLISIALTGYFTEGLRIIREQTPQPEVSYVGWAMAHVFSLLGTTPGNAGTVHFSLWWIHTFSAFALIAIFPYTRLFHSVAGALSLVIGGDRHGVMVRLEMAEVEETGLIGVGRVQDFSRHRLIELDACVSCGRCEDACPAHEAGKPLSPRNVVQDIRRHFVNVGPALRRAPDGQDKAPADPVPTQSLVGQTISPETVWSCTTCHACADVCPLGVNPMGFITDMRRHLIGEAQLRGAPATSLQKMQRSGNPWGLPPEDRFNWAEGLDVPTIEENRDFEILYWVGCAASYDRRLQRVARATVKLLHAAKVNFAVLGTQERCTGESARRMGDEFLFQELAQANVSVLRENHVKKIVSHCPHCVNSFKNDYPQMGGCFEVVHHSQFLMKLVADNRLCGIEDDPLSAGSVTLHDPCYLARVEGEVVAPRRLLAASGATTAAGTFVEARRNGCQTSCCGAGGGRMWFDDAPDQRIGVTRVQELLDTGADTLAVACPFCLMMLSDGVAAKQSDAAVKDVAELLVDAIERRDAETQLS